jgi:hypothetical protein
MIIHTTTITTKQGAPVTITLEERKEGANRFIVFTSFGGSVQARTLRAAEAKYHKCVAGFRKGTNA